MSTPSVSHAKRTLIPILVFVVLVPISCMGSNVHFTNLVNDLLGDYRKELRPVINHLDATIAALSMQLTAIDDLDEKDQVFVSSVVIEISYHDEYLSWDPSNYSGLQVLIYPQEHLWIPDLIVENSVEETTRLGHKELPMMILNTGRVVWRPKAVLRTTCNIDVAYYPFDTQTCTILLSTWMSTSKDVRLMIDVFDHVKLGGYQESGAWELVSTTIEDLSGQQSRQNKVGFNFTIKRRRAYYILNSILPIIALSLTASLVFGLPADAGEKVGMSITVLLAYAVYLSIIMESMPKTSLQVSIMGVYITVLLTATALSVVFTVFVLHIHHSDDEQHPPGNRWRSFTLRLRPLISLNGLGKSPRDESREELPPFVEGAIQLDVIETEKRDREERRSSIFPTNKNRVAHGNDLNSFRTDDPLDQSQIESKVMGSDVTMTTGTTVNVQWRHVGETIDRLLFIVFTIFIAMSSLIFVLLITFRSP